MGSDRTVVSEDRGMMNSWQGKIIIGLTGNIATGKSEVRRMLERLGAFGIDAERASTQDYVKRYTRLPGGSG